MEGEEGGSSDSSDVEDDEEWEEGPRNHSDEEDEEEGGAGEGEPARRRTRRSSAHLMRDLMQEAQAVTHRGPASSARAKLTVPAKPSLPLKRALLAPKWKKRAELLDPLKFSAYPRMRRIESTLLALSNTHPSLTTGAVRTAQEKAASFRKHYDEAWNVSQRLRSALRQHYTNVQSVRRWLERADAVLMDEALDRDARQRIQSVRQEVVEEARTFDELRGDDVSWALETMRHLSVHLVQLRSMAPCVLDRRQPQGGEKDKEE